MNKQNTIPALPGFGPVGQPERIETLDILRGFALLCILIVNWSVNTKWGVGYWNGFQGTADVIADYTVSFLLDEKSWPMFAFLFGLGFSIQMQRAESRSGRFITVYSRRLIILLLIGAAHYILTERDILYSFAVMGFLLLPVRKLNLRLLIILSLICITGATTYTEVYRYKNQKKINKANSARSEISVDTAILDSYVGVYEGEERTFFVTRDKDVLFATHNGECPRRMVAESTSTFSVQRNSNNKISFLKDSIGTVNELLAMPSRNLYRKIQSGQPVIDGAILRRVANKEKTERTYLTGSYGEIVSMRAGDFWKVITSWTSYFNWLGWTFPLFLLGLYTGGRRIFHSVFNNRKFIRKVMWWGLTFGLIATTVQFIYWELRTRDGGTSHWHFWPETFIGLMSFLGSTALGLGYLATLTLLLQRGVWKKMFAPFASVGQMALTNYLLQSVAFIFLFFGFGLGWFGKFGAFGGAMLALFLFALQIVFSRWWLRHFRFGPFEWLWRSLTYWKFQPMRKKQ
ncbi:MAG TPA: DUF418 domain-containing protein [Chitinophagaceae bacterium]|nr:DUF418 domain-containing protein [Chitinophagaceae bacterium]